MEQITPEWIAEQRQISEIVDMACEYAPGSVVPLLKQIDKSQTAALDALEAAYAEIARLTAERDAAVQDLTFDCNTCKNNGVLPIEQCEKCGTTDDETNRLISYYEWRGQCAANAPEESKDADR